MSDARGLDLTVATLATPVAACYNLAPTPKENPLDTQEIVAELEAERDRLSTAIAAFKGIRGRELRAGARSGNGRRGRRRLSAAARKRITEGMNTTWGKRKRHGL